MVQNIIGDIHRILAIIILVKFLHMPELGKAVSSGPQDWLGLLA